jgi:chloramphenicol 3-O phosphotransferase
VGKLTIIYLHGASSSGKTVIARELQELLGDVYLHVGLDTIFQGLPGSVLDRIARGEDLSDIRCPSVSLAYHKCVEALASIGFNLIIEDDSAEVGVLVHLIGIIERYRSVLIGIQCPLDELARRETQRGDRPSGHAAAQFDAIHRYCHYDFTVDSSAQPARECAVRIQLFLQQSTSYSGVEKTKIRLAGTGRV